jgi:hypothetical protein
MRAAGVSALERMIDSMPAGDPRHPIPFPFGSLTDDEFDELVYLVAHAEEPAVAKIRAPDGGLDTVQPDQRDPTRATWGIQAKLHREQIKWSDCKASLDRAVECWRPDRVTFAFPRDLTENQHKLFHKHLTNRHLGVTVDWWGSSKLTARLIDNSAARGIAKRFFHTEDPADLADRAIRAGGPLRTAHDLLEREGATGEFLRSADPHFDWVTTKRTRSSTPIPRSPGAAMRLEFSKGDEQLIADAIPRTPAAMAELAPRGALLFSTAEERAVAEKLLAAVATSGGRAVLHGAMLRMQRIPAPFDELFDQSLTGEITVKADWPAKAWAARVAVDTDEGSTAIDVDLQPAESEPEWDAELVGHVSGLTVTMRFVWSHSDQAGRMNLTWCLTGARGDATARARILAFVIALHGRGTFTINDREEQRPGLTEQTMPAPVPDELRLLQRIYEGIATIQRFAGRSLGPPPDVFPIDLAEHIAWLSQAVLAGGYDATITSATMTCDSNALAQLKRSGNDIEIRDTLVANLLDREVEVAERITKLPLMQVKQVARLASETSAWEVELVPATGDSAPIHVELKPPPASGGVQPTRAPG